MEKKQAVKDRSMCNKIVGVAAEIRKQPPAGFLFRRVKRAFNGRFCYGNSFLRLALAERLQDELLKFGIVQIGAHSPVPVEQGKLASAVRHHASLEPQASAAVKHTPFHG